MKEFLKAKLDVVGEEIVKLSAHAGNGDAFIKKRLRQLKDESIILRQAIYDLDDGLFPADVESRMINLRGFLKKIREGKKDIDAQRKKTSPRKLALNLALGETVIKARNERAKDRPEWISVVKN